MGAAAGAHQVAPAASGMALELREVDVWVTAGQGHVDLLRGVDWQVERGQHWAVLGPNGAGKSSLLSVCAAMRHPSRGAAWVLGRQLGRVDLRALRERIGVVDASSARRIPSVLSLLEVTLTGVHGGVLPRPEVTTGDDYDRAAAELVRVGLKSLQHRRFGDCSQGERQRALLARALVADPELLLLDEAAVGLDLPAREALLAALDTVARNRPGLTSVTVTHHVEELPASTSHALLLAGGALRAAGALTEVLTDDRLSDCFDLPVRVRQHGGRWSASAAGDWRL